MDMVDSRIIRAKIALRLRLKVRSRLSLRVVIKDSYQNCI